jgi:hypothetical protein
VDELPFAADRCPCVEKLRTCYQLLLASETVQLVFVMSVWGMGLVLGYQSDRCWA